MTKQCTKCSAVKDAKLFMKRKDSKDGLRGWCRKCMQNNVEKCRRLDPEGFKKTMRKTSAKFADRRHQTDKKWRKSNPDKLKDTILRRTYGITLVQYRKLLAAQNNACPICKDTISETKTPHTDHCHKTNRVRGILCPPCNKGIGFLRDRIDLCFSADNYLEVTHGGSAVLYSDPIEIHEKGANS